jgi:hypothetical protein
MILLSNFSPRFLIRLYNTKVYGITEYNTKAYSYFLGGILRNICMVYQLCSKLTSEFEVFSYKLLNRNMCCIIFILFLLLRFYEVLTTYHIALPSFFRMFFRREIVNFKDRLPYFLRIDLLAFRVILDCPFDQFNIRYIFKKYH